MSKELWKIRPATPSDIEVLVALRAHLLDGTSTASYASRTPEERLSWKAAYRGWLEPVLACGERVRIVVAERNNEVVACATGLIYPRPPAPDCQRLVRLGAIDGGVEAMPASGHRRAVDA